MQKFVDHKSNYLQNMFDVEIEFEFDKKFAQKSYEV